MNWKQSSHLFQRVASFLQVLRIQGWCWNGTSVLISFREWLHSYKFYGFKVDVGMAPVFSSLSESGFIPTTWNVFWRRNQVLSVLISFREWLHSYTYLTRLSHSWTDWGSHLFQRVASFLLKIYKSFAAFLQKGFSSLSESGFIPTKIWWKKLALVWEGCSHLFQRVASFLHVIREILVSLKRLGFSSLSESGFIPTDEARAVL